MSVEDIESQSNVISQHDSKDPISRVHVSQASAEPLVRSGGITNHHSIVYSLSNISAKNNQNHMMCVEVIVFNVSVVFFETQCSIFCTSYWFNKTAKVSVQLIVPFDSSFDNACLKFWFYQHNNWLFLLSRPLF